MRSERQREILREIEAQERAARKSRLLAFCRVLSVIYILAAVAFCVVVYKMNVLPEKYIYGGAAALVVLTVFIVPVMFSKNGKKGRKILASICAFLLIGVFGIGTYYLADTIAFFDSITDSDEQKTESFYLIVRSESADAALGTADPTVGTTDGTTTADTTVATTDSDSTDATTDADTDSTDESFIDKILGIFDKSESADSESETEAENEAEMTALAGQTIATYMSHDLAYSEAKSKLQEKVAVEYAYAETAKDAVSQLIGGSYNAAFISAASYASLSTGTEAEIEALDIASTTKIIYTISIPVEETDNTSSVDVTSEPFNIYISGSDMEGSIDIVNRTDVNMIATVNPTTNEVLLTSIPRDYYVTLPSKEAKDKLTHSSLYGMQESIGAIENELGIDINYYLRVNYTTIITLVDAIGGIEIESDRDFYTSGMKGMPELNGHHFVKGINQVDGKLALAFCRERHAFSEGDMKRNENQQQVMEAIIKKATSSTTILTKYTSLLDAVKDNLSTNMTQEEMASIIKMQLDSMPSWNIEKQSIKGINNTEYCYSLGFAAATVDPIPEEEMKAIDKIVSVMQGGTGTTDTSDTTAGTEADSTTE